MPAQPDYRGWERVPEEMIVAAADMAQEMGPQAGADSVNFRKVLMAGHMFKAAGLTPIYVWCEYQHKLAVYAEETHGKKLH